MQNDRPDDNSPAAITSRPERASNPDVGSSSTRTRGRLTIEQAIVTRRFWPPEIPRWKGVPILLLAISWSPRDLRVASMWASKSGVSRGSLIRRRKIQEPGRVEEWREELGGRTKVELRTPQFRERSRLQTRRRLAPRKKRRRDS